MNDLAKMVFDQGNALNERFSTGVKVGAEAERKHHAPLVLAARGVIAAYARASGDEKAKIPTLLHVTIEAMKLSLPELRTPMSRAAEIPGRPDHDMDVFGRQLKAGS
jgi:hypothetical protein